MESSSVRCQLISVTHTSSKYLCSPLLLFHSQKSRYVSQLIAEEFWTQGDIERQELNVEPQPMFDRSVALSTVQIGNIIVYNSKKYDITR